MRLARFSGWLLCLAAALCCFLAAPGSRAQQETEPADASGPVYVLSIDDGIISAVTNEYIEQGIAEAKAHKAQAVLIQLDTPGGMLASTHQIVKTIMNAPMPVIVYVSPAGARAGSAGVFITMAAHVAAMHPSSHIGAAHPVDQNGNWPSEEEDDTPSPGGTGVPKPKPQASPTSVMSKKILNDTISAIRVIAKSRNRNEDWAIKAVLESDSITAQEALNQRVVDMTAYDTSELLNNLEGHSIALNTGSVVLHTRDAKRISYEFTFRQQVLAILTNPMLAYLLLMVGFYGIIFEVTHPGVGISGTLGVIALALALTGMQAMSFNMAGLLLISLGLGMFAVEIYIPTLGFLSVTGVLCLITGALLLYQTGEPFLMSLVPYVTGIAIILGGLTWFVVSRVVKTYKRKALSPYGKLVGQVGQVISPVSAEQGGKVQVYGEIWDALADEALDNDTQIEVLGVEDHPKRLRVARLQHANKT